MKSFDSIAVLTDCERTRGIVDRDLELESVPNVIAPSPRRYRSPAQSRQVHARSQQDRAVGAEHDRALRRHAVEQLKYNAQSRAADRQRLPERDNHVMHGVIDAGCFWSIVDAARAR